MPQRLRDQVGARTGTSTRGKTMGVLGTLKQPRSLRVLPGQQCRAPTTRHILVGGVLDSHFLGQKRKSFALERFSDAPEKSGAEGLRAFRDAPANKEDMRVKGVGELHK